MRHALALSALGIFFVTTSILVDCGGSSPTEAPGADSGADGPVAPADAGRVDTSVPIQDSSLQPDTSNGADTGPTSDGAPSDAADGGSPSDAPADDGSPSDAAPDVVISSDGGTAADGGPGGDGAVLSCGFGGGLSCPLPAQSCCVYDVNDGGLFVFACSGGAPCPATADAAPPVTLTCEIQAQCAGNTVCCITSSSSGNISARCQSTCGASAGESTALLCDPTEADAGCGATDAGACSSTNIDTWTLPTEFGTCGGKAR